jgi:hypothetical protein
MKSLNEIKKNPKVTILNLAEDGGNGFIQLHPKMKPAVVVFSWGLGWDHVSVSYSNRCLTWDEMCVIKAIFFKEDEWVAQYHPAETDYVNNYPYCLHLWRPQKEQLPHPPKFMV